MGRGKTEHHVAICFRQTEQQTGDIGGSSLSKGTKEDDQEHNPHHIDAREDGADVDKHAHTYQEIGDKQGIADKLNTVHQWRHAGDISAED